MHIKGSVAAVLMGLIFIMPVHAELGNTRLRIVNKTKKAKFKVYLVRKEHICEPLRCPRVAEDFNKFLGLFPPNDNWVTADWIPRSLDWDRLQYRVVMRDGKQINVLCETGSTWSFAMAKVGGNWGSNNNANFNKVDGTDLWIKTGASGLIVETGSPQVMQISPHINCRIDCVFNGPFPDYVLTFTDDASPDAWVQRELVSGQINVVVKNATPVAWDVIVDGLSEPNVTIDGKKSFELEQGVPARALSFSPTVPRENVTSRDGSIYLTFVPKQSVQGGVAYEKFVLVLYKVKTLATPIIGIGPSRFKLSKTLVFGNVCVFSSRKDNRWNLVLYQKNVLEDSAILKEFLPQEGLDGIKRQVNNMVNYMLQTGERINCAMVNANLRRRMEALRKPPLDFIPFSKIKEIVVRELYRDFRGRIPKLGMCIDQI